MNEELNEEREKKLILLCKEGNQEAFSPFIELYKNRIFYLCYKIVKDREIAEDLTQQAFVRAFQKIKSFREQSRFHTWIYRIAFNLSIDQIRKKKRLKERELKENIISFEQQQKQLKRQTRFLPMQIIESEDLRIKFEDALASLPPHLKEVFILYALKRVPQKKIAQILQIKYGTVRSRLYYARVRILNYLTKKNK